MEQLFVYGTLKCSAIQEKVIGRVVAGLEDVLEGYDISTIEIENETFPVVVGKAGSSVEGLVLSVTSNELACVDLYETEAYQRKKVMLRSGKECWVYASSKNIEE